MVRAITTINLKVGRLNLNLDLFKCADDTTSVRASEVTKVGNKIYKVQRKPFYVDETGTSHDLDKTQILKSYEKEDGTNAIFTKSEQNQLLKKGSSREWKAEKIIDKNAFNELSFQKEYLGFIAMEKDKDIINKRNLKFFKMLKQGLKDRAIITSALFKNTEYVIAISNYGDKLLVRFLRYSDEVRNLEMEKLPELSAREKEQAESFANQYYTKEFRLEDYKNETQEKVLKIIESRGTNIEVEKEIEISNDENPFI